MPWPKLSSAEDGLDKVHLKTKVKLNVKTIADSVYDRELIKKNYELYDHWKECSKNFAKKKFSLDIYKRTNMKPRFVFKKKTSNFLFPFTIWHNRKDTENIEGHTVGAELPRRIHKPRTAMNPYKWVNARSCQAVRLSGLGNITPMKRRCYHALHFFL